MKHLHPILQDALPGAIAAGLLSATEQLFFFQPTWEVPLFGLIAGGTVYAADHRLRASGEGALRDWLFIGAAMLGLFLLALNTPWFSIPVLMGFFLLSVGYVLHLPRTTFRLQEHPWIRIFTISMAWGGIPLILHGLPFSADSLSWMAGNAGLFFSAVLLSDLNDLPEDTRTGRTTPSQRLSTPRLCLLIRTGYIVSMSGYLLAGAPVFGFAPVSGLLLLSHPKDSPLLPYSDLLLLWPGIVALSGVL